MRKLKLDLDALAVETFAPDEDADGAAPGTVRAHAHEPTPVVKTLRLSNCVFSACATCGIYC
jgi:hypothetical protein